MLDTHADDRKIATAVFAGGCFWCMEKPFETLDGVQSVAVGYTGGKTTSPTYEQVSSGITGHTEAIRIQYDPSIITYNTLLSVFWRNIDPLDARGQFCDKGSQYRSAIFYLDETQQRQATISRNQMNALLKEKFNQPVATEITPISTFYLAEAYHQKYHTKNPVRYALYRYACGRDKRLQALWID